MAPFHLEYPITRVFPWPWFTPLTLASSLIVLVLFTLLNVAATGYETVPITSPNFNMTQSFWWSPFDRKRDQPICNPKILETGDTFRTTNEGFAYTIQTVTHENAGTQDETSYGYSYSAQLLREQCLHFDSPPLLGVVVDRPSLTLQGTAHFTCDRRDNAGTVLLRMENNVRPLDNNVLVGLGVPQNSSVGTALNMVTYNLAMDVFIALLGAESDGMNVVRASTQPDCLSDTFSSVERERECVSQPVRFGFSSQEVYHSNGSLATSKTTPDVLPRSLNQTIDNYLHALYATLLADIGVWNPNSILVSQDMLNSTISSPEAVSEILQQRPDIAEFAARNISSAEHYRTGVYEDWELEMGLRVVPIPKRFREADATIATLYQCNIKRRKDALSLLIAVIVADLSMFTAFWGLLMLVSTFFVKQQATTEANSCVACCNNGKALHTSFSREEARSIEEAQPLSRKLGNI